jgi:hypothetical protein
MKLVMTLLVRDEEDVLAANLDYHLAQGVDQFIITDNLSVDGTRDIVESYVRRKLAVYLYEPNDDYSQFRWVTRMARMAAVDFGADWVINNDADEFWASDAPGANLKSCLARVATTVQSLTVPRFNFIPMGAGDLGFFAERMTLLERESRNSEGMLLPPKVCHRALPDVEVGQGNHGVSRAGVPVPSEPCALRILHYPMRSYRQFENKIARGGAAYARNTELSEEVGITWRNLYKIWQAGDLLNWYLQNVPSPEAVQRKLSSGELVHDETVLRALRIQQASSHALQGENR